MRQFLRGLVAASLIAGVGLWLRPPDIAAQAPVAAANRILVAATTAADIGQWSARIDGGVVSGALRRQARYSDPVNDGWIVESFVQRHNGLEVLGGDLTRISEGARTLSVSGSLYMNIDVATLPTIDLAAARAAIEQLAGAGVVGQPTLMILPTFDGRFALAYRAATEALRIYYLDAHSAQSLLVEDAIFDQAAVGSGTGALGDRKKVSASRRGGEFAAWDLLRPGPIVTLDTRGSAQDFQRLQSGGAVLERDLSTDADNVWTHTGVVDTHANLGFVYDYFFKRQAWQGMDGSNGTLYGVVNTAAVLPNNAFFITPPFGPAGNGGVFFGATQQGSPFTVLDVVGHEVMHGVLHHALVRRTGTGLGSAFVLALGPTGCAAPFFCDGGRFFLVSNESGGLNEGFADIFGVAAEFYAQPIGSGPLRAEYVNGEDLALVGAGRSLEDPAARQILPGVFYPDHVSNRIQWPLIFNPNGPFLCGPLPPPGTVPPPSSRCDLFPAAYVNNRVVNQRPYVSGQGLGLTDAGSVHMNLSILGHAFYLAIEGGRNRTSGQTVVGVGAANREQVERVFFVAVRDLLPRFATFTQAAVALREAARVTYGAGANVTRAVNDALVAVGL
jgi:Zn-dependent metalloprotease